MFKINPFSITRRGVVPLSSRLLELGYGAGGVDRLEYLGSRRAANADQQAFRRPRDLLDGRQVGAS